MASSSADGNKCAAVMEQPGQQRNVLSPPQRIYLHSTSPQTVLSS